MSLSGFAHPCFGLFLLVALGFVGLYVATQIARRRRVRQFAAVELLDSVAPIRPSQRRHLPAVLLTIAMLLFTIALAGPTEDIRVPRNRAVVMLVIVPISITFGTPNGYVDVNGQRTPVPVDDQTMKHVAELSGGTAYNASSIAELKNVYSTLQEQIGYEPARGDASASWLRLGALVLASAAVAALLINRRLPI